MGPEKECLPDFSHLMHKTEAGSNSGSKASITLAFWGEATKTTVAQCGDHVINVSSNWEPQELMEER